MPSYQTLWTQFDYSTIDERWQVKTRSYSSKKTAFADVFNVLRYSHCISPLSRFTFFSDLARHLVAPPLCSTDWFDLDEILCSRFHTALLILQHAGLLELTHELIDTLDLTSTLSLRRLRDRDRL